MLQFVEHLNIDETGLSVKLFHKMTESIVLIVLCGQFQKGFPYLMAEIDDLTAQGVVRHLDGGC
jgi:hypothetical protein